MKLKQTLIYFSLFAFHFSLLYGQRHDDRVVPMRSNPALVNYVKQNPKVHSAAWRLIYDSIKATLPFFDDFSHGGPYPDSSLWIDNAAFINNTYPICPPTLGVATLDGVDNRGQPYNPSCPPGASYPADSLTSRPIDLTYNYHTNQHTLGQGDSVWFSFYWQAGGRGFLPLTSDTLIVQFRTSRIPWTTVWYQLGYAPGPNDTGFHSVMIPLFNAMHVPLNANITFNPFDDNFQFRFKNYACTSADADQWNIDEVNLDEFRTYRDTSYYDVSFVYESPRILANYEYMPWEQFTKNDLVDKIYLTERNNINITQQITYHLDIPSAIPVYTVTADINPFPPYDTTQVLTQIPIKSQFTYSPLAGPTDMEVHQYFTFNGDVIPSNNVLSFDQVFHDFYAYDDGTAEASYFINGNATPIYLAEQITLNNADTLRGLELYFNYMFVNPANYNMRLTVWADNNGSPGSIIFENADSNISTPRIGDTLNGFTFYPYVSSLPLRIPGGTTIYVGWIQTNGDSLNIGFDYNTNHANKIFYWDNAFPALDWQVCSQQGSIMMRPVFGSVKSRSPELAVSNIEAPVEKTINLYPNPANNSVTLSAFMAPNTALKIYTADGRECMSDANFYGNYINTSSLPSGFYIVEVTPQGGQTSYQKLLIQR